MSTCDVPGIDLSYSGEEIDRRLGNAVVPVSNPNLLRNWYFAGGGSQQGGGQLPINQTGQTEWTAPWVYTIGSWLKTTGSVALTKDGLVLRAPGETIWQKLEPGLTDFLLGKLVTMSVLFSNGDLVFGSGIIQIWDGEDAHPVFFSQDIATLYFLGGGSHQPHVAINNSSGVDLVPFACKLEFGDRQTLARQTADGKWVLNDPPPNFQQALAEEQRYYWVSDFYFASREFYNNTHMICNVQFPVKMRAIPAVTLYHGNDLNRVGYWAPGVTLDVPAYANAIKDDGFDSVWFGGETVDTSHVYAFAVIADARL